MTRHMEELAGQIKQLELQLLHTDWRENPALIDQLLSDGLEEIGINGQISSRQQVVDWLLHKDPAEKWLLTDFRVKRLTDDTVMAIYRAVKDLAQSGYKGSVRSSIWQQQGHGGHWKMVFHQATKQI